MFLSTYALFVVSSARSLDHGGYREGLGRCMQPTVSWTFSGVSVSPFWIMDKYVWQIQNKQGKKAIEPGPQILSCFSVIPNEMKTNTTTPFLSCLDVKKMPGYFTSTRSNINAIYKD